MSGRQSFSEKMARLGYDPYKRHPEVSPPPKPVYLGRGEWGPPGLEDDRGHGSEDDEFLAELMKDEPTVPAPERPWYDGDG